MKCREGCEVMARGRVLQGVLEMDTGLPWVRVKLEVNGGAAAREWRVQRPVMMDREGHRKDRLKSSADEMAGAELRHYPTWASAGWLSADTPRTSAAEG